ncbi:rod shape-determining protein RodA [Aquisalinus flavus]|uniref:Peptidoglycan glycosyltransferase MrdB n=1 Tax=Aquisalinus flavus TaxID=1526572 RepID=A0A8J2V1M3_9PROT|nr:rod shape-determining protein RodA [Aquisalinus flavus]MBD0427498.1 rod shape-determining protein RodA [Aquisalinus flavus]UNE47293.1 rod shape-determining protein RodA [Aquisalinus flavus]GGD01474.1 rod shape-determining protein RodA [Aquisalinus flavus]
MNTLVLPDRRGGLRKNLAAVNWWLVIFLSLLAATGVATLYSVADGSWTPWALNHIMRYALGLMILMIAAFIPLRFWLSMSYPAYFFSLGLLALVPVIGEINMGAQRWIVIGGFQLQPSEIMKVALVMALARYYHGLDFKRVSNPIYLVIPLAMISLPVALVFLQPDLGTAILLGLSGIVVILLAGLSWRIVVVGAILGLMGVVTVIQLDLIKPYQIERITSFTNPEADPLGAGYHLAQSKIAIGSGGVTGKGYMNGTQSQLDFLPEMHTDFIFTIFGEEFGFFGTIALLGLYLVVFLIGTNIAMKAKSHYGRLVTMGICITFISYVLINTGMVMGLAPVVGVPLPLVSYGGTVMLTMMAAFGLVMSTWINRDQDTLRTSMSYYGRIN